MLRLLLRLLLTLLFRAHILRRCRASTAAAATPFPPRDLQLGRYAFDDAWLFTARTRSAFGTRSLRLSLLRLLLPLSAALLLLLRLLASLALPRLIA